MVSIHKLDSFYATMPFKDHDLVKDKLLELIAQSEYTSPKIEEAEVNITKTDWNIASDMSREWLNYIAQPLLEELAVLYRAVGFDGLKITEIWFQQYLTGSEHGWHSHSGNFTNVYYLELPEGTPPTLLVNPYDKTQIIEVEAKEGDLLMFPSYVLHKAPINKSDKRKTILSYNIDATVSDEIYGVGIGKN